MVSVGSLEGFQYHADVTGGLPFVRSRLRKPRRRNVAHHAGCLIAENNLSEIAKGALGIRRLAVTLQTTHW